MVLWKYRNKEGMKIQEDYPATEKSWERKTERLLYFSSLSLPQLFCSRIVYLCFHPFLISVLLQAHLYLYLILTYMYTGLQYTHTMLHQRTTNVGLGLYLSSRISSVHVTTPHKECLWPYSSHSICWMSTYDLKLSSYMYVSKHMYMYIVWAKMAYRKETTMCVWRRNSSFVHVSDILALIQKIDISDSTAVIQYVKCPHMTCSFQVTSLSMHKMSYWKVVAMCVWILNLSIKSRTQL